MINSPSPESDTGQKMSGTCVPLKALTIDGTPPTVGDEVEFTTKGKVARVEGEHAYISPSEVNGEPYTEPAEAREPTAEEDDEETLRIAKEADGMG